jgi:polysaccharide biosynthesis protein PslH
VRILWTLPYLPWPITSGGKSRQYHLIKAMAERGHDITLLIQSKAPADADVHAALSPLVRELIVLPRRPLRHPRTLWRAATSPRPLLTSINGDAPVLTAAFERLLDQGPWDAIQIEHSYGFEPFEAVLRRRGVPFVLCEHNVESALGAATYGGWPRWAAPLVRYDQWRARRWERQVMAQAEQLIAVTQADADVLGQLTRRPPAVVENGVDTRGFAGVRPQVEARQVLFVGNYEYAPNVDAVAWALDAIWPRVWARCPEARFVVCGHAMPTEWAHRWPDARIDWRGYVDSLPAVQGQSSVFLAPLRSGGGSKLKVLEALAAGLPLVSTSQGVSGLGISLGSSFGGAASAQVAAVSDGTDALADAIVHLLTHPDEARAMGERGRAHVQGRFDWQACGGQLEATLLAHARRKAQGRGQGEATASAPSATSPHRGRA